MIRIMFDNAVARPSSPLGATIKVLTIDVTPSLLISMANRLKRYQEMDPDVRYWMVVNGKPLSEEQIYHVPQTDEWAALLLEQLRQQAVKRRVLARQRRANLASGCSEPLKFGL